MTSKYIVQIQGMDDESIHVKKSACIINLNADRTSINVYCIITNQIQINEYDEYMASCF
jgi:hypothetical protein